MRKEKQIESPFSFQTNIGNSSHIGLLPHSTRLKEIKPKSNPYITGTALPGNSPVFFGRVQLIHEICGGLAQPEKSPSCISLLGERRMGKSSFLNQVITNLGKVESLITIFSNARNWEKGTPEQFFASLFKSICTVLPKSHVNVTEVGDFASFRDFLLQQSPRYRFVIIIDEFEKMAANEKLDRTFFSHLRAIGNGSEYSVGFALSSRLSLSKICNKYTHFEESNFWNIFKSKVLGLLSKEESCQLIEWPMNKSVPQLKIANKFKEEVLQYSGYSPAMIQLVMSHCLSMALGGFSVNKYEIRSGLREHYKALWDGMNEDERYLLVTAARNEKIEKKSLYEDLMLFGLLTWQGKPFSIYFGQLIRDEWALEVDKKNRKENNDKVERVVKTANKYYDEGLKLVDKTSKAFRGLRDDEE